MPHTHEDNRRRRRRRPGENWDLWAVCRHGLERVGYLVTDRGRLPRLVAFVPGATSAALARAVSIRDGAEPGGAGRDVFASVADCLLLPVTSRGGRITTDSTFAAARFVSPGGECGPRGGFKTYPHAGLEIESHRIVDAAQKKSVVRDAA